MKQFLILLFFLLTTSVYTQITPYIIPEDYGSFKKGDTVYIMDKATKDDLYIIMYDNLAKDDLLELTESQLDDAKKRLALRDSVDASRKEQDNIRKAQISNLEPKLFDIKGVFFEGNATYIPKLVPLYEAGFFMNISIKDIVNISPGFKAFYFNSEFNIGPSIRLGVKLY